MHTAQLLVARPPRALVSDLAAVSATSKHHSPSVDLFAWSGGMIVILASVEGTKPPALVVYTTVGAAVVRTTAGGAAGGSGGGGPRFGEGGSTAGKAGSLPTVRSAAGSTSPTSVESNRVCADAAATSRGRSSTSVALASTAVLDRPIVTEILVVNGSTKERRAIEAIRATVATVRRHRRSMVVFAGTWV